MIAIIGAVREHRVSVILTGSITLIMYLSLIFTAKDYKWVNIFVLILLASYVQSLIFSEMLKEKQTIFAQRRGLNYLSTLNGNTRNITNNNPNSHLAAVVVYQTPGSTRPSTLFMVDPEISSELAKDPPPSYFALGGNCSPPKYEDAIKLNAGDLSLPAVQAVSGTPDNQPLSSASPATTCLSSGAMPAIPDSSQPSTNTNNSSQDTSTCSASNLHQN